MPLRRFRPQETFDADLRRLVRIDSTILGDVRQAIEILLDQGALPEAFHDHPLLGRWSGYNDFHVREPGKGEPPNDTNDVVVIYKWSGRNLVVVGVRAGTHEELFSHHNRRPRA